MDTNSHNLSDIIDMITRDTAVPSRPYLRIVEQPTRKPMRFRYECEGRTAGTIPGENSSQETKTCPTVEIVGYTGKAVILVSCVTKEKPYRQHPHQLVGPNCKSGVCTRELVSGSPMRAEFSNVGIQCVRKREIAKSLEERKKKNIDPFRTGFDHINDPNSIELNSLRLCFQAFLLKSENRKEALNPVVSEPLHDRKANSELFISRLCSCAAKIDGGDELILLCSKVNKDDVKIRFKAIDNHQEVWHAYATFEPSNVHKQTAIAFRTPRYPQADLPKTAKAFIELECPSLDKRSDPLEFTFHDPGMLSFATMRRKLKRKPEVDIFQHVLSMDSETTATKYYCPQTDIDFDLDDNCTPENTESTVSKQPSLDTLNETESVAHPNRESSTDDADLEFDCANGIDIELEVPHITYPPTDADTQTSTPIDDIFRHTSLVGSHPLTTVDKINEWMHCSEFERTDSLTVENGDTTSLSPITVCTNVTSMSTNHTTISTATDEDRTFTDYNEPLAELDEVGGELQSRRGTFDNPMIQNLSLSDSPVADNKSVETMVAAISSIAKNSSASQRPSMDVVESFDDTSTYNSLKIAFKSPMCMPIVEKHNAAGYIGIEEDGLVVLKNPPAPKICVNVAQTPPSSFSPPLPLPPRTPSPGPEQHVPPLPPKRNISQELVSNSPTPLSSIEHSRASSISSRPPSQIFIMRTPDQSPTKRQSTPTSSPKKRHGFFSRFFTRRKSKSDTNCEDKTTKNRYKESRKPAKRPRISEESLIDQMNKELGLNLNYPSFSVNTAFNLPVASPPIQPNVKDEPAGLDSRVSPPSGTEQFYTYRSPMSPLSQTSPLSQQDRYATPSPISVPANGSNTDDLCGLLQGSTLQPDCQMHNIVYNEQENHVYGAPANINSAYSTTTAKHNFVYNEQENHVYGAPANINSACSTTTANRNNICRTSGGSIQFLNAPNGYSTPTYSGQAAVIAEPQPQRLISEDMEGIERIKRDLMLTSMPLMQTPPQPTNNIQNGWLETAQQTEPENAIQTFLSEIDKFIN